MIRDTSGQDRIMAPNKYRRIGWIAGSVALFAIAAAWAMGNSGISAGHSVKRSEMVTATITRGTLVRDIVSNGKIVAANAPVMYASAEGMVTLLAKPGDTVSRGQILATIDSPLLTNALAQEQARLAGLEGEVERATLSARREQLSARQVLDTARVELDAAERESRRGDLLIAKELISRIDFEKVKDDYKKAQLRFDHAEQEVALMADTQAFELKNKALELKRQQLVVDDLRRQVAALEVVAPVDGIIGNWLTEQKARLSRGQAILTVVDLSAFEAELAVSESYADELGLGMAVELDLGGLKTTGTLASISPEVSRGEVLTRVRFDNADGLKLRQNQRLSARILLENLENVLMVRRGSFVSDGGNHVYRIEGDIASRTPIKLGARSVSHVQVLEGGQAGDEWIISGSDKMKQAEHVSLY
ncbi:efflux RND transporter periplasmic adaptor subunit [Shewanella litorisediminis]|uniref:HlyD family efflux transporter periplasmic adaptor subunit n=1 Tax=Shewanella litorisediminis TaxID=1173586 RepID=A0ABX7G1F1_9GAMM|nr:HlyD family efflux transporter periplasmic adaptor subunit [Shewanella litorisediminis]MCL2919051.1 HlyD family efflux transporter periplasmic adaptor subunit [Shewanella litorisediminis]QRH01114.1 HlyD family efflux transporter periplasmic adaptor subunit [Shewanella litorisediminis]